MLALDVKEKTVYPKGRSCQSGTKLVREYEGKKHKIVILDGYFDSRRDNRHEME